MSARTVQYATVASGDLLSGAVAVHAAKRVAIVAPNITSAQVFIRGATDATSAGSARAFNRNDGTSFNWAIGSAGGFLEVTDLIGPAPYLRIETGVAQTLPRSFAVITSR
jgi:hypothetical protein